jgi:hypothetical protein
MIPAKDIRQDGCDSAVNSRQQSGDFLHPSVALV